MNRRLLLFLLFLLVPAGPANAGPSVWTPTPGLTEPWTREFETHLGAMYAGTETDGVFTSPDGGASFAPVNGGLTEISGALAIRSLDSIGGMLYAGTTAGLFRLAGSTWQPVGQAPDAPVGKRLDKAVQTVLSTGGVLLAGVASGGVYRSTDNGATWIKPPYGNGMNTAETVWGLSAHPTVANRVLAATGSGVFVSNDAGATWTPRTDGIPWGATTLRVVVHQALPNVYYVSTLEGVYRSITAGETWAPINGGLTNDTVRGVFLQSANRMYAATENGVYGADQVNIEDPFEVRWRLITNNGLDNTIFWALNDGFFGAVPNTLLGGTQDGAAHITLQPPDNTTAPAITAEDNLFQVGKKLTVSNGNWNGTPAFGFTYEWFFCPGGVQAQCESNPIDDATNNTFVLRAGDAGDKLRARVTAVNAHPGPPQREWSAMTPTIAVNPNDLPTSAGTGLTLTEAAGTPDDDFPEPGDKFTSPAGTWTNGGTTTHYQWLRCSFDVPDSCEPARALTTSADYFATHSDIGFRIRVERIGANSAGSGVSTKSASSNKIFPPAPVNLELPVVAGATYVGESLFGSVGTWKSPTTQFSRRWMRCEADGGSCTYIQMVNSTDPEIGPTYTVRAGDLGYTFKLEVKGDPNGPNEKPDAVYAYSAPSGVVVPAPPEPVDPGGGGGGGGDGGGTTPGGGGGGTIPPDTAAPTVSIFKTSIGTIQRGKPIIFVIHTSEPGSITLTIQRQAPGRKKAKKCVKPTRKLRRAKKCKRWVRVGKPIVRSVGATLANISVPTSRKLRPGRYRATLVVRDAAGNASVVKRVTYRIKR